jgi:hypothetical protein
LWGGEHLRNADVNAKRVAHPEVGAIRLFRWFLREFNAFGPNLVIAGVQSDVVKKRWPPARP